MAKGRRVPLTIMALPEVDSGQNQFDELVVSPKQFVNEKPEPPLDAEIVVLSVLSKEMDWAETNDDATANREVRMMMKRLGRIFIFHFRI